MRCCQAARILGAQHATSAVCSLLALQWEQATQVLAGAQVSAASEVAARCSMQLDLFVCSLQVRSAATFWT